MKETQQSRLSKTGPALWWKWRPRHAEIPVSSLDEIQNRTGEVVLLFLDLERITRDKAYLEFAKSEAKRVADEWEGVAATRIAIRNDIDPTLANILSRATFTLTEGWKATRNSAFRDAEIHITRCIAAMESAAGRGLDSIHKGEK